MSGKITNMKTTNYFNTFIEVSEDCPVAAAEVPSDKNNQKTVVVMQFEMIRSNPYKYTSDEVLFYIYSVKNDIPDEELSDAWNTFFSKGQA